jgi:hypothetical protein
VVQNIWNQRFALKPLAPKYLKWKAMNGRDTRILISTGKYVDSIRMWKVMRGKVQVIQVGVYPNKRFAPRGNANVGVRIVDVARWLEYGTTKMPARPVWFLTLRQLRKNMTTFRDWHQRQVNKVVTKAAKKSTGRGKRVV